MSQLYSHMVEPNCTEVHIVSYQTILGQQSCIQYLGVVLAPSLVSESNAIDNSRLCNGLGRNGL
jgi:hypothetical protein